MERLKILIIVTFFCSVCLSEDKVPIKVIIDAGHGGKDGGAVGSSGLKEKDSTLEIALLLQKIILEKSNGSLKPLLTRSEDKFLSLDERVVFANQSSGDLFVSLHLNASQSKRDKGFEVYYNDLTSDEGSKEVADRENIGAEEERSEEKDSLFILWDLAQNEFLKESAAFADIIQSTINNNFNKIEDKTFIPLHPESPAFQSGDEGQIKFESTEKPRSLEGGVTAFTIKNRGVKQSSFVILRGVRMPAVLIEMGFVTNATDEEYFRKKEFKERYAEALFNAINVFKEVYKKKISDTETK